MYIIQFHYIKTLDFHIWLWFWNIMRWINQT